MIATPLQELREIVRAHRVHFDVEPEFVLEGPDRVKVGFHVTLWAVHDKGARALPGCPACWDLAAELRQLAESVVPPDDRPSRTEVDPFRPALYESRVLPGSDEVSLTIRLVHRDGYDRPVDACEQRCLQEIRARLLALGVRER